MRRCNNFRVRTTLNIDDDVLRVAKSLAATSGKSLGQVVSELIRKGLEPRPAIDDEIPSFKVGPQAKIVTPEMVREALDDEW